MDLPDKSPAVFYFRNRMLILMASPIIVFLCFTRILAGLRSGDPWLNWLAGLVVWLHLLLIALCRRLVLTHQGLDYTEYFTTIHVPWAQVTRLVSRKALGIWRVEGLEVWVLQAGPKDRFIDFTQFNRSWRQDALGTILQQRAPHLFHKPALRQSAS